MNVQVNTPITRQGAAVAGLIGGWFSLTPGGPIYGITCNHVIANINNCAVGDILVNEKNSQIGTLTHWLRLRNTAESPKPNRSEFALFRPMADMKPTWGGTSPSFVAPKLGQVCQFQIATFSSAGVVVKLRRKVSVTWNGKVYRFLCTEISSGKPTPFSLPGHSGGLVLTGGYALGLILGKSLVGNRTYVLPFVGGILDLVPLHPLE